jgi:hypothetical protein
MLLASVFALLAANVLAFPTGDSPEEHKEDELSSHAENLSRSRSQFPQAAASSFSTSNENVNGAVVLLEPGVDQTCQVAKNGRKSCLVRISHKIKKIFAPKKNKTENSIIAMRTEKMV